MSIVTNLLSRLIRSIRIVVGLLLILIGTATFVAFSFCRIYVGPGECVVQVSKFGKAPPADQTLAEPGEKGIMRATLGPGRHFYNPINYDMRREPLVRLDAGDPNSWTWAHTISKLPVGRGPGGNFISGKLPEVGILTRKVGKPAPSNEPTALKDGFKGIIREVLTPGDYRINPYEFGVEKKPALVIPTGFVGVVTNQIGLQPDMIEVPDVSLDEAATTQPSDKPAPTKRVRPLAGPGQRGTLANVLPPGVYYTNPYLVNVKIIEVGFNEFSQLAGANMSDTIRFPSKSGFDVELGVTVVWGLQPRHAAQVINEFGNTEEVLEKVIKPQLRSICRNEGSLYEARDFIQGDKREEFQGVLTRSLRDVCARKNIELLLALISTIEVHSPEVAGGGEPGLDVDLKTAIQDRAISIEQRTTNVKRQETAKRQALLETAKKQVEVARETVQADTRKKVATMLTDGRRRAAVIEAEGRKQIAEIEKQIADVDAMKIECIGKAKTDVIKLKNQAAADGKKILVQALGSGEAYNLYSFARNFDPQSIRLIFAGPGTFWTDLKKFEELGAAQVLKQETQTKQANDEKPR